MTITYTKCEAMTAVQQCMKIQTYLHSLWHDAFFCDNIQIVGINLLDFFYICVLGYKVIIIITLTFYDVMFILVADWLL